MTYVVCEPCEKCKYADCVDACPVDCFYESDDMLFINPEECIDCDACPRVCPVDAIFLDDEVPEKWTGYIEKNAQFPYSEETRRTSMEDVTRGPNWDPKLAGANSETVQSYDDLLKKQT